jgi:hypothetical protein
MYKVVEKAGIESTPASKSVAQVHQVSSRSEETPTFRLLVTNRIKSIEDTLPLSYFSYPQNVE